MSNCRERNTYDEEQKKWKYAEVMGGLAMQKTRRITEQFAKPTGNRQTERDRERHRLEVRPKMNRNKERI